MTRIEALVLLSCASIVALVWLAASRIDPLAGEKIIFQEHGWDDFKVCRQIGTLQTCRTVADIFR